MRPILVLAPVGDQSRYEIGAGERRSRAAKLMACVGARSSSRRCADEVAATMGLIENIRREDLNLLE